MTRPGCGREPEIVRAVVGPGWPADASGDLQAHVTACDACREVLMVATLFRDDPEPAAADLPLPAAGQVWWRAAVRARLEATHAAARPMTWAQGVAAACAAGVTVSAIGLAWPTIESGLSWIAVRLSGLSPAALEGAGLVTAAVQRSLPLALATAASLVLAPLALYLALSDD